MLRRVTVAAAGAVQRGGLPHRRCFASSLQFGLTEEQIAYQDMARQFAISEIAPHAAQWDEKKEWPAEMFVSAGQQGFGAVYCGEEFGGTGASRLDAAVIFEQLAAACPAATAMITIHNMCCWMVDRFGSPGQRANILPNVVGMENVMSYCLTEPGSGSDAAALKTTAKRDGTDYKLNGTKSFISGAGESQYYLIMARTGEGAKGISCFCVPNGLPGLSFGKNEIKMGWNCQPTRQVILDNVRVPEEALLGEEEGLGFKMAMMGLDGGRINIGVCSLGAAQSAFDHALRYTKERSQFGKPLSDFQNTQFQLANMAARIHSARLLLRQAAVALDVDHPDKTMFCAMAKMEATEKCFSVVDDALQLHGGYGYLKDYHVEKMLRDLRVHRILEGTNEIMRVIISRQLLA